jgi:hypothetical protein
MDLWRVDDFSEIIYQRQSKRKLASDCRPRKVDDFSEIIY